MAKQQVTVAVTVDILKTEEESFEGLERFLIFNKVNMVIPVPHYYQ